MNSLWECLEYLIKFVFGEMGVHNRVIDVHHWRLITRRQTLDAAQGKPSIWSGFASFDAQLVFEIAQATACPVEGT